MNTPFKDIERLLVSGNPWNVRQLCLRILEKNLGGFRGEATSGSLSDGDLEGEVARRWVELYCPINYEERSVGVLMEASGMCSIHTHDGGVS